MRFYHFELASFISLKEPRVEYSTKYMIASSAEEAIKEILNQQNVKPNPIFALGIAWIDEIYEMCLCPHLQIKEIPHKNKKEFMCNFPRFDIFSCLLCQGIIGRRCESQIPLFKIEPTIKWVIVHDIPYKVRSRINGSH